MNGYPGVDVRRLHTELAREAAQAKRTVSSTVEEDRVLEERERVAARGQVYQVRRARTRGRFVLRHRGHLAGEEKPGALLKKGERPTFRGHVYEVVQEGGPGGRFVWKTLCRVADVEAAREAWDKTHAGQEKGAGA